MLNYPIEPAILSPFVPNGTELDSWNGTTYVSVVGFLFVNTRVSGLPIPFHRDFEEVNLRFYVRRQSPEGWRRGVVFLKEIVPRAMIALTAQTLYNEPYIALPMSHRIEKHLGVIQAATYSWRFDGAKNRMSVQVRGGPEPLQEGSQAEFITEHYWGYTAQRDGSTLEYRVEHPRWQVYDVVESKLECDVVGLYGRQFVDVLGRPPTSAFLAEGSPVTVNRAVRLRQ